MRSAGAALLVVGCLAACLDPADDDTVDSTRVFGDPSVAGADLPHVEDNPALADKVALFPGEVPYVKAYASGRSLWYWRVPGPNVEFIVPFYRIIGLDGVPMGPPIIDVIPGDLGYSPWWRVFTVQVTDKYAGEKIWSRDAVDLGVRLGILEPPQETEMVVDCPIVLRDTRIQVASDGTEVEPAWAYYRNQRVSWVVFRSSDITWPVGRRNMPVAPFYRFQRINQSFPLVEPDIGRDLNGDGDLLDSNNIFQFDVGEVGYTALWYPIDVRTVPEFRSIDTASTAADLEFTRESDFIGPIYGIVISDRVVGELDRKRDTLRNCPIQPRDSRDL